MAEGITKLERALAQSGITEREALDLIRGAKQLQPSSKNYVIGGKEVYFTLMGDTHCGHKCYDSQVMDHAKKNSKDVDFILHGGDVIEGHYESHRPGHVFELTHIGADAQVNYAAEQLSGFGKPLFFIEGNHMANTIYKKSGYDVGKSIEAKVKDSKYLGIQHGTLEMAGGRKIQMIHPDGGTAYAISYKPQKIVESLEGGSKPAFLSIHHFHKSEYLFYRNIHVIQAATLERQTSFMKNNGIPAHVGYWKVRLKINQRGITEITPTYFPFY